MEREPYLYIRDSLSPENLILIVPMENKIYVIGIDPQINVLAVCVVATDNLGRRTTLAWFQEQLKRKDVFGPAEVWEVYMIEECKKCIRRALQVLPPEIPMDRVSLWVEQQRGRCKTIPEAALASIASSHEIEIHIPHPKTWKRGISFPCILDSDGQRMKGNKHNKQVAEQMFGQELNKFYTSNGTKIPKVIHHLCDAGCLAYYGILMKEKGKGVFISMCDGKIQDEQ